MKDRKGVFIGIAVIAVIIIAGIAAMAAGGNNSSSTTSTMSDGMSSTTQSNNNSAATADAVAADTVTIQNYMFNAPVIKVKAGTKVTWTNMDSVHHNISPDSPTADFKAGDLFGKGETYSHTFTKAGTYKYHCDPHPYMHGTVVVTE